jgi:hypothetical protein
MAGTRSIAEIGRRAGPTGRDQVSWSKKLFQISHYRRPSRARCIAGLSGFFTLIHPEIPRSGRAPNLDFSNISVHRGRESEKDVVLQQFL